MPHSVAVFISLLIFSFSSIAFAQTSQPGPRSPQDSLPQGACFLGNHQGVSPADAGRVSASVCAELRRHNLPIGRSFVVEIQMLSQQQGSISLSELGSHGAFLRHWEVPVDNLHDIRSKSLTLVKMAHDETALPPRPSDSEAATAWRWYGWQTLIADGMSVPLLFASALQGKGDSGMAASMAVFCAGAPGVHLFNGNPGRASISLGARALTIAALSSLGHSSSSASDGPAYGNVLAPVLVGILIIPFVVQLDAALLSFEKKPVPSSALRWNLAPTAGHSRVGLSFAGVF